MFKKSRYIAKVPVAHLKIVELVVLDKMAITPSGQDIPMQLLHVAVLYLGGPQQ